MQELLTVACEWTTTLLFPVFETEATAGPRWVI